MRELFTGCLLTWRLTNLCVNEEGPFDVFGQFRDVIGVEQDEFSMCVGRTPFAQAFCCFLCASVWIGCAVALIQRKNIIQGLVYSAGAIMLNTLKVK